MKLNPALSQWMTPAWAAEAIVDRHFADLGRGSRVLEPSCGEGAFLGAIPASAEAIGVEIDPLLAEVARARTGRAVITGDFRTAVLPSGISDVIGNPPFSASIIESFIRRAWRILPEGGRVGFLLPVYVFQTTTKVLGYAAHWRIEQELLPRNLFPGIKLPLLFARFTKARDRRLVGFLLYRETAEAHALAAFARDELQRVGRDGGSVWRRVVNAAFDRAGDRVHLSDLYKMLEGGRPTANPFWKAQIRKVLQTSQEFVREGNGRWRRIPRQQALPLAA